MQCLWIGGGARLIASGTVGAGNIVSGITTSSLKSALDSYKTGYTFVLFYIEMTDNYDECWSGRMKINNFINWYNTYYSVADKYYTVHTTGNAFVRPRSVNSNSIDVYAVIGEGSKIEVYVTN